MAITVRRKSGMFFESVTTSVITNLSTALGAIIGAFLLYVLTQAGKFTRRYMKRNTIEHQLDTALHIQELLTEARLKWGAARVYVFQFSNGTYYANQVSQLNMTCTHQSVAPGVSTIGESKKEYLVSQYPEMFSDLLNQNCIFKDIDEIDYPTMKAVLMSQGVKTFLATSFSCPSKPTKIEGFVGIDYMTTSKAEVGPEVCNELSGFTERIGEELRS